MSPPDQAKVLRDLAERIERGQGALTPDTEEALVRQLEDLLDGEALEARRGELTVAWEKAKHELGV